jgi:hypothetical protein
MLLSLRYLFVFTMECCDVSCNLWWPHKGHILPFTTSPAAHVHHHNAHQEIHRTHTSPTQLALSLPPQIRILQLKARVGLETYVLQATAVGTAHASLRDYNSSRKLE